MLEMTMSCYQHGISQMDTVTLKLINIGINFSGMLKIVYLEIWERVTIILVDDLVGNLVAILMMLNFASNYLFWGEKNETW